MCKIIYDGEECVIHENVNVDFDNVDEETFDIYLVFEMGYGNTARISSVAAPNETEACEHIDDIDDVCQIMKLNKKLIKYDKNNQ